MASVARRFFNKVSFKSLGRGHTDRSNSLHESEGLISTPSTERAPIPTMMQSSAEVYATPLPKLTMIVLSITMLGEFLSANVSTPFLLFMVRGFGEFADEAEVAFWTGILVATFFLTQFLTSLLWATIAEKHGRRVVLIISLLGSGITCLIFGTATTLQQAICIRLLQGIFAGAVGVARGCVGFVTDPTNESRAYAILGFCWGFGAVAGAIIGGSFERPATKWPQIFGDMKLFITYPYLLPCGLAALVLVFGAFLSLFVGPDGGPREGAIRLPPEKIVTHPTIPEEDLSPLTPVFDDAEHRGLSVIPRKLSRRFSGYFAKRVPDAHNPTSPLSQPALAMSSPNTRLDRTRTFSRTSRTTGSAYGYSGAHRNRLASNATLNARRGSLSSSLRRRRGSNFDGLRDSMVDNSDLNFAQRLLLANENAVTNIADLWVASAINADNEDPFETDSDIEENEEGEEFALDAGNSEGASADVDLTAISPSGSQDPRTGITEGSAPMARLPRTHRPSTANSLHPSAASQRRSSPMPHRPSVSFSPMSPPSARRPSNVPSIFAHPGVKTPPAVLDAQQLLLGPDTEGTPADPLAPITESRTASNAHSQVDVESMAEKQPSLISQLPIIVIIQYGVMALHTTTHDQIFMSYLVSDYESGGLNLNAGHFAQLIALMCLAQIAYQFYLYPNIGPPRGRFSHLAMFRIGTVMFIPAYLTVVLYRPFANKHSQDDSNPFLMLVLSLSTAIRYCGTTFGYTAISILLNYMTPPNAVGYANGIAQSIVSLARCVGPVIGGYLWSTSVKDGPSGYYFGFVVCSVVCAFTVVQSFLIR
ncbi:major facilitator superfamily MFS-1 [Agrocybe pediades]|nr:major facilitator superfamily MFS-1 [Agrocybe pediades]